MGDSRRVGVLGKILQVLLYIPVQVLFIPFAIVGLIDGLIKEMGQSRRLGVSYSAVQALQYRWIMHYFDTRPDPVSVAFIRAFPCESHFGLWTTMGALIIAQRVFGLRTRMSRLVGPGKAGLDTTAGVRVVEFDRIVEKHLGHIEQLVLPGAGFDLLAIGHTRGTDVKVFELDQEKTLRLKVETLERAGIDHDWISYIPVDYENESWAAKLEQAGFDRSKPTLFIWQSVSLYLDVDTVKQTLRELSDLCNAESVVAQDFYSSAFVEGRYSRLAKKNMDMIERMGEVAKFGLDMSADTEAAVESFVGECGFSVSQFIEFGRDLPVEPFYCIVETVPST